MKIRSIRLSAYGPFTDVTIDLPDSGPALHIVFGPNEAGKSSALKALRHMLFGIPAQTPVNFLHGYTKLRVGAGLVNSKGDEIDFLRRKGRSKTLRSPDDENVLDDDALAPFLGGVGAEVFEQMFAIGHEDLIRGGEEIISGKGSVGEALFASGAGLIRLQHVQNVLAQECGALFKPSGSMPLINRITKAIKESRKNQKGALLLPKAWQAHDRAFHEAKHQLKNVKKRLGASQQKRARLERIMEALPLIARKKEIDASLAFYQGVPDLGDDFGEKRRDAEKELKVANRILERSREAVEKIKKEINALPISEVLLENASAIESLQHDLGSFRKAQKDRPGLEGRMRTLQKQASDMLEEIGSDISGEAAKKMKLPPSTVGEIQKLGKAYERSTAKQESAEIHQRKLKNRFVALSDQRKEMPVPKDVSQLETALLSSQEAGPIEKQLTDMHTSIEILENELSRLLKRQTVWHGSLKDVDELPLPSRENLDRFENRFDASHRAIEKFEENKTIIEREIVQVQTDIQAIDLSQEVPTETDLKSARSLRDKGWGLIRQDLEGQARTQTDTDEWMHNIEGAADLTDAFEKSMVRADHIADRLRREAGRVSKKGLLEAQKEKLEKSLADIESGFETSVVQRSELKMAWQKIWEPSGITPQTPREMRGWLSEIVSLREKLSQLQSQKTQSESLTKQLSVLKSNLLTALEKAGLSQDCNHPLSWLMKTAQAHSKAQRDAESNIESADKALAGLQEELEEGAVAIEELESVLFKWKIDWEKSVKKLGLSADAGPTVALAVIESVREARNKINEADVLRKRIEGIDRDSAEFSDRVKALIDILASELKTETLDRAAELLNGRLTVARRDESKKVGFKKQLASAKKELEEADKRILQCNALIETLCKEANCTNVEALSDTEKRARKRGELIKERNGLEQHLRRLSAGATVDTFLADASSVDADGIDPELRQLEDEMEGLETDRSELDQKIGALKVTLKQMDGSSKAAIHAENAEHLLASLSSDVEKFARLKIASVILSRTVEQYREKHQGPLISRASELFAQMTLGSFSRLRADYDEKGNPVLVGIRPRSEAPVHVSGMSDGTADQLYLALRLASLEQYLENNEPLPFVVDDILLRFDDDRALATLDVLDGLSKKTQVLFFTHHRHLVELAERSKIPKLEFLLHRL